MGANCFRKPPRHSHGEGLRRILAERTRGPPFLVLAERTRGPPFPVLAKRTRGLPFLVLAKRTRGAFSGQCGPPPVNRPRQKHQARPLFSKAPGTVQSGFQSLP